VDIQAVNTTLVEAIVFFQECEVDDLHEAAMAHGVTGVYRVPSPRGQQYTPPPPSKFSPAGITGGGTLEERVKFSTALLKQLKKLKKDLPGTKRVYQGYKGTGKKKDRRQVFVDFDEKKVGWQKNIDMFINPSSVDVGGVLNHGKASIITSGRTVKDVYKDILEALKAHLAFKADM